MVNAPYSRANADIGDGAMRMILFILIAWIVLSALIAVPAGRVLAVTRVCVPAEIDGLIVWLPEVKDGIPQENNQALATALYAMRGPDFTVKTATYIKWDIPDDWETEARFVMLPGRQEIWFASSFRQPDRVWIWWFPNDAIYRTPTVPYGIHPCKAMVVSRGEADAIYQLVKLVK